MQKNKKIIVSVVVCLVIALLSFRGGMMYAGKNITAANQSRQAQFGQGGFNQNGGRNGGQGMRSGGGIGGGVVSGDIISKDATSMTVKLRDGGSKIILLSPTSKVEKTVDGAISDVVVGKSVMVTGTTNGDGSVTASSVQLRPALPVMPAKTN